MVTPTEEQGYGTTTGAGWWEDEEPTPELRWPKNIEVYDKMRRTDAQVGSVLRAVTLPVRRTAWWVDPNGARPEVVAFVADNLGLPVKGEAPKPWPRSRDRFSWSEHLRLALLMLVFGHSPFEQVYRIEAGMARLRKLAWRPPRTISTIEVASDGGLVAIQQYGTGKSARMTVDRLVMYVNDREGGNWVGQSLLRPAYKFWLLKDRLLRVQAQTVDRNGMGVPVYTASEIPASIYDKDPELYERLRKEELARGEEIARAFRSGNTSGAAVPNGAKLELLGVQGTLPDADKPIRYYDEQIARAVLAHFLNLGTETGSWALGSTFADFFTLSLQSLADDIADVATQHVVEDLVDINFGESEPAPKIGHEEIGSRSAATAEAIKALVECGAFTADDALEAELRRKYGLPVRDPDTARPRPQTTTPSPGSGTEEP